MKKNLFFSTVILVLLLTSCAFAATREIALSFDDGPDPVFTPLILKILKAHGAEATFFVKGKSAELFPDILRAEHDASHEIGNHTYDHPRLTEIGDKYIIQQIAKTQNAVFGILGIWPKLFRPPYSARDEHVDRIVKFLGLAMPPWTVSPADYECPPPETIAQRVLSAIVPGAIVVMHDNCPNTPAAVEIILKGLKEKNLQPVTISKLLRKK